MEQILLLAIAAASNIACFVIGAKVGQFSARGRDIVLPALNPVQAIQERREKKEAEKEQSRIDAIMRNIEAYDGTEAGQTEIPGR